MIGGVPAACLRWLTVGVATATACLAWAGSAQAAAITTSSVNVPADGALLLWNQVTDPDETFSVSGTTNGGTGDAVDINCYNGETQTATYEGSGSGVPVAADGSFTAQIPADVLEASSCELLAVPHGTTSRPTTGFTGPRVGISTFFTETIGGSGPNAGDVYDFDLWESTLTNFDFAGSIGQCGPGQLLFDGTPAMDMGPFLLDCAGSLYASRNDFGVQDPDLTRSEIEIDGANAYGSLSAYALNMASPDPSASNTGFPPLTVTLNSFDLSTGAAQTTESEGLVECSPSDVYNPTEAECSSFTSSGVSLTRVIDYAGDRAIATVTDTYSSTDGKAHALDLDYETDLYDTNLSGTTTGGWELPGETSFTAHSTGDTAGPPPSAPGTIYAIYDTGEAPSLLNPVAAMSFAGAYNSITFDSTLWGEEDSALIDYQRTLPAGGSVTIQWSYATEASLSQAQADAAAAQAAFAAGTPPPVTSGTPPPATSSPGPAPSATPPLASTGSASELGSSTAKVSGTVTPAGAGVSYYFQYGTTNSYGHETKPATLAAGASAVPVDAKVSGLTSETTYHYRLVAGTSHGSDRTFTTLAALKHLTVRVSPHRLTSAPYRSRISGSLALPRGVTVSQACRGKVTVLVKHGAKTTSSHTVTVTRKCTYTRTERFTAKQLRGHGTLTFTVTFNGNSKIGTFAAKPVKVRFV